MAVLGERFGARVDEVAAAQSLRMLMVVLVIPSLFVLLELRGADAFSTGTTVIRWSALVPLLAATAVARFALQRMRVPNAFVLGALAVAIPLSVSEVYLSAMPRWLLNGAQLLLGSGLGARFNHNFPSARAALRCGGRGQRHCCHRFVGIVRACARVDNRYSCGHAGARYRTGWHCRNGRDGKGIGIGCAARHVIPCHSRDLAAYVYRAVIFLVAQAT